MRVAFLLMLALAAPALADDVGKAADKLLATRDATDRSRVIRTVLDRGIDLWLVLDELCARDQRAVALQFADALPKSIWLAKLREYVVKWRSTERFTAARRTVASARLLRLQCRPAEALAELARAATPPGYVTTVVELRERASALRDLDRHEQSRRTFVLAAKAAVSIGWQRAANHALRYLAYEAFGGDRFVINSSWETSVYRRVRENETLVAFDTVMDELFAIVVTTGQVRCLPLGKAQPIEESCRSWRINDVVDRDDMLVRLRRALVEPLDLAADTKRVIVANEGVLASFPWRLLVGDREVSYSTCISEMWRFRADKEPKKPGTQILAVAGDQPGMVEEAQIVGGVVLSGDSATRLALTDASKRRERWRAVHIACRYAPKSMTFLLDEQQRLNAYDLKGFSTDLLVLSADSVRMFPKGRAGMGLRGALDQLKNLARVQPHTGPSPCVSLDGSASRVMVSLWRHDPEASRTFMRHFYRLWNGEKKLSAAAALRAAQNLVRQEPRWRDPRYWAGWQLWGEPD